MASHAKCCKCNNHVRNGELYCSSCTLRPKGPKETKYFSANGRPLETRSIVKPFSQLMILDNEDEEEWELVPGPKEYQIEPLLKSATVPAASASTPRSLVPMKTLPWDHKDAFRRSVGDWSSGYKVDGYGQVLELDGEVEKVAVEVKPYHPDVTGSYVSDAALVFGE